MTKRGLARQYKVSTNTIASWLSKGLPHIRRTDGSYHFDRTEVRRWRAENLATRPAPAQGGAHARSYIAGRARKETALAELRELELRRQKGELVPQASVDKEAFETGRIVRDALLRMPDRLAGLFAAETDPRKIHALMTKEIRQVLEALSQPEEVLEG
jgi:phage terminase Nu1 subunit (DNA packaging protein)